MLFRGNEGAEGCEGSCGAGGLLWLSARKRFRVELEPELGLKLEGEGPHGDDETVDTGRGFLSFLRARWEDENSGKADMDVGIEAVWWPSAVKDCR